MPVTEAITFGDVFWYEQKPYVFLTKSEELLYAAEILNPETSKELIERANRLIAKNHPDIDKLLYCFVQLSTAKFKDRACFLGRQGIDDKSLKYDIIATLGKQDLDEIIAEIKTNKNVANYLVKWVKEMKY